MKIKSEVEATQTRFDDIKNGEPFRFYDEYFIKMDCPEAQDNAINLIDGSSKYFSASDMVEVIECEIVIK